MNPVFATAGSGLSAGWGSLLSRYLSCQVMLLSPIFAESGDSLISRSSITEPVSVLACKRNHSAPFWPTP